LQSAANVNPSQWDLETPVVITVHGFSATTFEWNEFCEFAKSKQNIFTSQVLLGSHGRDYADFKSGTWQQWQQPIIDEYNKLRTLGYKKISFACSSTGCPLVIDILKNNKINTDVLKHIFLIDPIVVPSNKTMTMISVVGPILNYVETAKEKGEDGHWYKFLPYQAIGQLNNVSQIIRKYLESGIKLPNNVGMTVYKSKKDNSADPISAVLIKKGLKLNNGSDVEVQMIDSDIHVVTRLRGRNVIADKDFENRNFVFNHIYNKL
jgi:carboxylesterase